MKRRVILAIALVSLGLLALAMAPWSVSSSALVAEVARQLREGYGLDLAVNGRTTVALLPVPRVKFESVSLANGNGREIAGGGQLRGDLQLWPLMTGTLQLADVSLSGAAIAVDVLPDGRTTWDGVAAKLRERIAADDGGHLRRLVLTDTRFTLRDRARGINSLVTNVNAVLNWPSPADEADLAGTGVWRGETVEVAVAGLQLRALASGTSSPVAARVATPLARLVLTGTAVAGDDPRFTGRTVLESRSAKDLLAWSGLSLPLGPLVKALALEGDVRAGRDGLSWPAVSLTLGTDVLDGALAVRFEGGRAAIAGTLAAEQLNLTPFVTPLSQARTSAGSWSAERIELAGLTQANLDLRLSTAAATLGAVRLEDVALNVMVKPGRIEAALGRAGAHRGLVKGRVALAAGEGGIDFRAQGSFERIDLAGATADLGQPRWIAGQGQGQVTLEGHGESAAEIVRALQGRATVAVRSGELVGIALADVLRRAEKRPLGTALDWRGGRTPFDQAHGTLAIAGGVADIVEGTLAAPAIRAALRGSASLMDRSLGATLYVEGLPPSPLAMRFDLSGPWNSIALKPDTGTLLQRPVLPRPLPRTEAAAQ